MLCELGFKGLNYLNNLFAYQGKVSYIDPRKFSNGRILLHLAAIFEPFSSGSKRKLAKIYALFKAEICEVIGTATSVLLMHI